MHLKNLSKKIKLLTLDMIVKAKTPHIGSCFSIIEILTALYFKVLNSDPHNPQSPTRDRFLLSKGHAAASLYATLAVKGFIPHSALNEFCTNGSFFPGHSSAGHVPGIEASTGSLGHALPIGVGMAVAAKRDSAKHRIFVLLSDGECDEGSNWEAILFAGHHKLSNIVVIVDYNKWQSFGKTKDILDLEPFAAKWKDFNWSVREVDGHDEAAIVAALEQIPFTESSPSVLIAHTVKGKNLLSYEDKLESHYVNPSAEDQEKIIKGIQAL